MNSEVYKLKYLKYKTKYLELKEVVGREDGGITTTTFTCSFTCCVDYIKSGIPILI
tara:strand:- start:76 stop:243 length:168 start_codon:yes stop_codon:yes gene_type:complete